MKPEKNKINKTTEYALIRSLAEGIIKISKPGRLRNKCQKLQKLVDTELQKFLPLLPGEYEEVEHKMVEFGVRTGWAGKPKHVVSFISFLLAMVEDSEFTFNGKITETLNEIFDYYDRIKEARPLCFMSGSLASEKWQSVKESV